MAAAPPGAADFPTLSPAQYHHLMQQQWSGPQEDEFQQFAPPQQLFQSQAFQQQQPQFFQPPPPLQPFNFPPPPLPYPPAAWNFPQAPQPVFDDGRAAAIKRFREEFRAERAVEEKYRRLSQFTAFDPIARARLAQLQYTVGKLAEMDRSAVILASQFPEQQFPQVAAFAAQHRAAANDGTRSLFIVMSALARPELGEPEMVRAATRAMAKDLPDFSAVSGVSAALEEEIEKRETALAAAAARAQPVTCHACFQVGHIAPNCPNRASKPQQTQPTKPAVPRTTKPKPVAAPEETPQT